MELLQRVRQRFPGTPEAATAVAWNTILYRLYLRAPGQPAYQFVAAKALAGTAGKLKDIQALAVAGDGTVYAATRSAVLLFDSSGKTLPALTANDARSILFDRSGRAVLVCREGVVSPGTGTQGLSVPKQDGSPRVLDDI